MNLSPKRHLDRFSRFFEQLTRVPKYTQTQTTLHATSVVIGHIYVLCAGDAAQKTKCGYYIKP